MRTTRRLRLFAMLVFTGLFLGLVFVQKSRTAHVMIIHSYDPAYPWVASMNEGLARGFEGRRNLLFRYHYMDLKNHTDEDFKRKAASLAQKAVAGWSPDVLLLIDDPAQDLVGRDLVAKGDKEAGYPVVFSGMNGEPASYYPPDAQVTGILERKPLTAIRDAIMTIAGPKADGRPRVMFIGDKSPSITAEIPYYTSIDWSPVQWMPPVQVETLDEWKAAVRRAGDEADLILLTNYRQIHDGKGGPLIRPAGDIMRWTEENATVPVLGMGASNSEDGAMLTVSVSPYEQGEVAAQLVLDVLDGEAPAKLGSVRSKQFVVQICARTLARWRPDLPVLYEALARATDQYFEEGC